MVRVFTSRRSRCAGHVARREQDMRAFKVLTRKPAGKRHLGRPRRRWEDSIIMELTLLGINTGNWVDLAQDRDYLRAFV